MINATFLIENTKTWVQEQLENADAAHDWHHTERVYQMACRLVEQEGGDPLVVAIAALLHDVADAKFHHGDETVAPRLIRAYLISQAVAEDLIQQVLFIVKHLSFRNLKQQPTELPIEFKIVQDADRLDAIGAIGIARAFHFGGHRNNPIHDPEIPPQTTFDKATYQQSKSTTINHFYEKLLLLKEMMQTPTAQAIAEKRHQKMLQFLQDFNEEWHAKDATI
ncbi:HD domain-containing protein [Riemerella columbina]|uniref:HD domain-containing protein n=1 Tax=Riemerella columbina TaxID=103810 RepID=UPI0026706492|nr:HD domain-containing protein [Riemerella columbina]WKS95825.1 HD domain-containing protein [Riemerella columbina]